MEVVRTEELAFCLPQQISGLAVTGDKAVMYRCVNGKSCISDADHRDPSGALRKLPGHYVYCA